MTKAKDKKPKAKIWQKNAHDVIDLWAAQSQFCARVRQAQFEGTRLYSYGHHYLMGVILQFRGQKVALINSAFASRTTSSHSMTALYSAQTAGLIALQVDGSDKMNIAGIREAMIKMQGKVIESVMSHFGSVYFWQEEPWGKSWEREDLERFNSYCKRLGMNSLIVKLPPDFELLWASHVKECNLKRKQVLSPDQSEFEFAPEIRAFGRTKHFYDYLTLEPSPQAHAP